MEFSGGWIHCRLTLSFKVKSKPSGPETVQLILQEKDRMYSRRYVWSVWVTTWYTLISPGLLKRGSGRKPNLPDGVPNIYMHRSHGQMFLCVVGERMPEQFSGQPLNCMIRGCQRSADVLLSGIIQSGSNPSFVIFVCLTYRANMQYLLDADIKKIILRHTESLCYPNKVHWCRFENI